MESLVKKPETGLKRNLSGRFNPHHAAFTSPGEALNGPESYMPQMSNTSKTQNPPQLVTAEDAIPLLIRRDSSQRISTLADAKENQLFKTLSLLREKSIPRTSSCSNSKNPLEPGLSFESRLIQLDFKNTNEVNANADEELRDAIDRGLSLPLRPKEKVVTVDEFQEQTDHEEDVDLIGSQDSLSKQSTLDLSDMVTDVIMTKSTTSTLVSQDSLTKRKTLDLNDMDTEVIMTESTISTVLQSEKPACTNSTLDRSDHEDVTVNPPLQQNENASILHPESEANEEDEPRNWSLITHENRSENFTTQVEKDGDLEREYEMGEAKNQPLLSQKNTLKNSAQARNTDSNLHEESEVDKVGEPGNLSSDADMNMSENFTTESQKVSRTEEKSDQTALVEAELKKMFSDSSPLHSNEDSDQENESKSQTPVSHTNLSDHSYNQLQAIDVTGQLNEPCLADKTLAIESFKTRSASSSSPDYNGKLLAEVEHLAALKSLSSDPSQNAPTTCRNSTSQANKVTENEESVDVDDQMRSSTNENISNYMNGPKSPIQSESNSENAEFNSTLTENSHDEQVNVSDQITKSKGSLKNELDSELNKSRSRSPNDDINNDDEETTYTSDQSSISESLPLNVSEKTEVNSTTVPLVNETENKEGPSVEKHCNEDKTLDSVGQNAEIRSSSLKRLDDEKVNPWCASPVREDNDEKEPSHNIDQVNELKKSTPDKPLSGITGSRSSSLICPEHDDEPTETDNQVAESRHMLAAELKNEVGNLEAKSRSNLPANEGHGSNEADDLVKLTNKSRNSPPNEKSNIEAESSLPVNKDSDSKVPLDVTNQIDNKIAESEHFSPVSESHSNKSIADVATNKNDSRNELDSTRVESVHVSSTSKDLNSGEAMDTDKRINESKHLCTSELTTEITNTRSLSPDRKIDEDEVECIAVQEAKSRSSVEYKLEKTSPLPSNIVKENEEQRENLDQITEPTSLFSVKSDSAGSRSDNDKEAVPENTNQILEHTSTPKTTTEMVKSVGSPSETVHNKEADISNDKMMSRNSSINKPCVLKNASLRGETHHISFSRNQSRVQISVNENKLEKDDENSSVVNKTSHSENHQSQTQLREEIQQNITANVVPNEVTTEMKSDKNEVDDTDVSKSPATVETLDKIKGKKVSSPPMEVDQLMLLTEPSLSTVKQTDNCQNSLEINNIDQECGTVDTSVQMDDHALMNKSSKVLPVDSEGTSKIQAHVETLEQQETVEEPNSEEKKRLSRRTSSSSTVDLSKSFRILSPNSDPDNADKLSPMLSINRVTSTDETSKQSSVQVLKKGSASEELQPEGMPTINCASKNFTITLTTSQKKINLPPESRNHWTMSTSLSLVQETAGEDKSKHQSPTKQISEKRSENPLQLKSVDHTDISQEPTSHEIYVTTNKSPKHDNGEVKEMGRTKQINSFLSSNKMNEPEGIILQTDQSITATALKNIYGKDHSKISSAKRTVAEDRKYENKRGKFENSIHIQDVSQVDESDDFTAEQKADQRKKSSVKQDTQAKLLSQTTKQTDALKILSRVKKLRNQTSLTPTDLTEIVCDHSQSHDVRPIRHLRECRTKNTKPYSRVVAKYTRNVEVSRVSNGKHISKEIVTSKHSQTKSRRTSPRHIPATLAVSSKCGTKTSQTKQINKTKPHSHTITKYTSNVEVSRVSTRKRLSKGIVSPKCSQAKRQRTPPTRHIPVTSTVSSKHGAKTSRTKPLVLVRKTNILPDDGAILPTQRILRSAAKKVKFNLSACPENNSLVITPKECKSKTIKKRAVVTSGDQVNTSNPMKRKSTSSLDNTPRSKVSRKEPNIDEKTSVMTRRSAKNQMKQILDHSSSNTTQQKVNIFAAVENGNLELLEKLIQDTGPAIRNGKENWSLLHAAVASDQCEIIHYLLKNIDSNVVNEVGETPAHVAAREGHIKALKILLADKEINPDKKDHLQRTYKDVLATPLFDAVLNGDKEKVEALVKLGANPDYHAGDIATGIMARELRVTTARQLAYTLYGEKYLSVFAKEGKTGDKTKLSAKLRPVRKHQQTPKSNSENTAATLRLVQHVAGVGTRPRGHVCILNFNSFSGRPELERDASEGETQYLSSVFKKLGYSCELHKSLTAEESINTLINLREMDTLSNVRCAIFVISSHSMNKESFLTSDMKLMRTEFVMNLFRDSECPQLKGKPKLFIFDFNTGHYLDNLSIRIPRRPVRVQEPIQAALCLYSETNGLTHFGNEGRSFLKALSLTLKDNSSNREFADFHRHLLKEYSTGNYGPLPEFCNVNFTQKFYLNPTRGTENS